MHTNGKNSVEQAPINIRHTLCTTESEPKRMVCLMLLTRARRGGQVFFSVGLVAIVTAMRYHQ